MQSLIYSAIVVWAMVFIGCVPTGAQKKQSGSSLFASTDGFAKEDLANLKPEHIALNCSKDAATPLTVNPVKVEGKSMEFPGDKLEDGMECFLVVRAPVDPKMQYTWLGIDGEGKPAVGLFYMSENALIEAGKLKLPIVKLYSVKPSDSFNASLLTFFNGKEEVPDAKNTEQYQVKLSAELTCQAGDETVKHRSLPAEKVEGQERVRNFIFTDLSVSKLKTAACTKVTVYEGNNDLVYFADKIVPPILFTQAEVGATVNISVRVDKYIEPTPFLRVESLVKCLQKDSLGICTKFELPREENIWMAELVILNKEQNTEQTLLVMPADGLESNNLKTIDVALFNSDLLSGFGSKAFKAYRPSVRSVVLTKDFDKVQASSLATHEETFLFGADKLEFTRILNVYVHGFHSVNTETQKLNLGTSAVERWIALVDVKLENKTKAQFAVTGATRYFESPRRANGKLFDWDSFVAERKNNLPLTFQIYTYADAIQGASTVGCGTPLSSFIDKMSSTLPSQMTYEQSEINYCEVGEFPAMYLEGYTTDVKMYVYGWQKY